MSKKSLEQENVSAGEQFRQEWAAHSGDWAFHVLAFLSGRRQNEVTLDEILQTETFARSTPEEQSSLKFVAAQAEPLHPLSEEDSRRLKERDMFLMDFADRKLLGHEDLANQIRNIPVAVAERQKFDRFYFSKVYESPKLFSWIWTRGDADGAKA